MIYLSSSASYGNGGKQYIARITGRNSKFNFEREFIGRKGGKRNESCEADVDTPGLYECRSIDNKGRPDDSWSLVWELDGKFIELGVTKEDAMKIAKEMDAGRPIEQLVAVTPGDTDAAAIEKHREKVAAAKGRDQDEMVDITGNFLGFVAGTKARRGDIVAAREKEILRLEPLVAGKNAYPRYEILTGKQADKKQVAQTIESAIEACWQVIQSLPEKEAKKVLAALKEKISPKKPVDQATSTELMTELASGANYENREVGEPKTARSFPRT